ncbi:unnamed protein product [Rotaria magnacalcarata]|nr:unnamed protein product [Rotaria magnacalcarata]CAF5186481.1 unnamed protein product [Rotaria magnacalcarata]
MQLEDTSCQGQNQTKKTNRKHLQSEDIPMTNRLISRSSSTESIHDEIQDTLHGLLLKQKELEHDQKVTSDWRALATKIDKFLFYVFLFLTIISTLGLLVVAPLFRNNAQRKIKLWHGSRRP